MSNDQAKGQSRPQVVIEAFDRLAAQKSPDAFAIVVLDNASFHSSKAFRRKELE